MQFLVDTCWVYNSKKENVVQKTQYFFLLPYFPKNIGICITVSFLILALAKQKQQKKY